MLSKHRGLGKGLSALIPSIDKQIDEQADSNEVYKEINIDEIKPAPSQARKLFDENKLEELAASIKEHGVIQPLVLRPLPDGGGYELIAGERRWRACRLLGYKVVPAIIKQYEDLQASAVSLIENVQREALNPLEEALAYQQLIKNFGLTQEEVSGRVGKSRPFVANMVRLLDLPPEIKEMLTLGQINAGHARALLAIKNPKKQINTALKIVKQQLSVRQAEKIANSLVKSEEIISEGKINEEKAVKRPYVMEVEDSLKNYFGTLVKLREIDSGRGKLEISYNNLSELKRIINVMMGSENVSRETFSNEKDNLFTIKKPGQ